MIQSHHNHEGIDFIVIQFPDSTFQACHYDSLCGYGSNPLEACQDAFSAESGYEIYPVIERLQVTLSTTFDNCNSVEKMARLGGVAKDACTWMQDWDNGSTRATYLAGFAIVCEALEAMAESGFSVDTGDIWVNSHAE